MGKHNEMSKHLFTLKNTRESQRKERKGKGKTGVISVKTAGSASLINIYYLCHLSYIQNAEQIPADLYNTPTIPNTQIMEITAGSWHWNKIRGILPYGEKYCTGDEAAL